jgi:hypothetical protein
MSRQHTNGNFIDGRTWAKAAWAWKCKSKFAADVHGGMLFGVQFLSGGIGVQK